MPVVRMVSCSDWVVLMIDGEVVDQNHSIPAWRLLEELQERGIVEYVDEDITDEQMEERIAEGAY